MPRGIWVSDYQPCWEEGNHVPCLGCRVCVWTCLHLHERSWLQLWSTGRAARSLCIADISSSSGGRGKAAPRSKGLRQGRVRIIVDMLADKQELLCVFELWPPVNQTASQSDFMFLTIIIFYILIESIVLTKLKKKVNNTLTKENKTISLLCFFLISVFWYLTKIQSYLVVNVIKYVILNKQ